VEINVKVILVYLKGDVCMSRVLLILATLVVQYAKEYRSMMLFLLPVRERTSGAFGGMSVQ